MGLLKGIDPILTADLLWVLRSAGHGDTIAIVDCNFPAAEVAAKTSTGRHIHLPGLTAPVVCRAIGSVLPLDYFVEAPIEFMTPDGPGGYGNTLGGVTETDAEPLMREVWTQSISALGLDSSGRVSGVPRTDFYDVARKAFAVVQTGERRPYANFIVKKGVIGPDGTDLRP
eukprot:TRINITY_DN56275_c0_g1_i1.p1 TRINITY_DN56275_c0_g1~~TRINITY_DN56275_c0_g1_i1.p1  ORF type:complete len:190 (+),score=9.80 TRINITY_DN56275_c0_g1_i1:58-570(+)